MKVRIRARKADYLWIGKFDDFLWNRERMKYIEGKEQCKREPRTLVTSGSTSSHGLGQE